jgi:hypothetical protein
VADNPNQPQLPGTTWFKGDFRKVDAVSNFSEQFTKSRGREYSRGPDQIAAVRADPNEIADLGRTVEKQSGVPNNAPLSTSQQASYAALHRDIEDQYSALTRPKDKGGMGVNVEVTADDPYPTPMAMRDDFEKNNRLKVYSTANTPTYDNPAMPPEINDKFRAVHDTFGHLATGRNFSRHGETGAFEHHRQMFSPESHEAMTSELKAQSAALYWKGDFQENKPYALTPEQVKKSAFDSTRPGRTGQTNPNQGTLDL